MDAEQFRHHVEDGGARHHPPHGAGPAQDHHDEEVLCVIEIEQGGVDEADVVGVAASGRAAQQAREGEAAFFDALKEAGIELRMKDIQVYPGGMKKADWDVGMAVDAIRMSGFLDVVVLVTGDGDFLPLVDYLKWGQGRVVEVAAFSRTAKTEMKEQADRFIAIEELPRALIRK